MAASPSAYGASSVDPSRQLAAAQQLLASGDAPGALAAYSEVIKAPDIDEVTQADALLNRALLHQRLGKLEEAVVDYTAALKLSTLSKRQRSIALYNRGLAHQRLGKPGAAVQDYTGAVNTDIAFAEAYYSRANLLRLNGQLLFALADYDKAIRNGHPQPHLALYGKALTYDALGRHDNSRRALLKSLAANPGFQPAREKLAALVQTVEGRRQIEQTLASARIDAAPVPNPAKSQRADAMLTGSIPGTTQVVRKVELPAPAAPSPAMLGASDRPAVSQVEQQPAPRPIAKIAKPKPKPVLAAAAPAPTSAPEPANVVTASLSPAPASDAPEHEATRERGWIVQINSQRDEDAAWGAWKKLQAHLGDVLEGFEPVVTRADLGSKGIFYRLCVHAIESKKAASDLCAKLKSKGTSCFVTAADA